MASDSDPNIGVGTPVPGSGVGSPAITSCVSRGIGGMWNVPFTHMSLEEYWDFVQVPEVFGFGIRGHPDYVEGSGCGDYWQQSQRRNLALAIAKSEKRLKADRWLGFPIRREYNDGASQARLVDYAWPVYLNKYLRGIGVEAEAYLQVSQALTLSAAGTIYDPVSFSMAVDFTDPDELLLYYPGQTKYRIRPSCVHISGGTMYVEIPRARLLKAEYFVDYNQVTDRPLYTNDSYFLTTIDVVRNYLNEATGANLGWHRRATDVLDCCGSNLAVCAPSGACAETLQLACGYIRNQRDGEVQFEPATYNGSYSTTTYAIKRTPDFLQVNYMRGYADRYEDLDEDLKRIIIAIAHNNFPQDPCFKCALQQQYYKRDVSKLEPPVSMGLGPSTWGIYESTQLIRDFDHRRNSHGGGML